MLRTLFLYLAMILALSACGGGSGGGSGGSNQLSPQPPASTNGWASGVFESASEFVNLCEVPRTGTDPQTGAQYSDMQGSVLDQNYWLRSWMNDTYLWYGEALDRDPGLFNTDEYYPLLLTTQKTATGQLKDSFSQSIPTEEFNQIFESGVMAGYGIRWIFGSMFPPRDLIVAYVEPGSPAAAADISRGAKLLEVDGVNFVNDETQAGVNTLNAGIFPSLLEQQHSFTFQEIESAPRTVFLVSASVEVSAVNPMQVIPTASGNVGYLAFHSHIETAERSLVDSVLQLQAAGISDLVLDLRYNGGGLIGIASQLAYMIAGFSNTTDHVFERLQFNDKYPNTNPFSAEPTEPIPFLSTTHGFSLESGQGLPTLDLSRLFVLTTGDTCSASESIINGLRGIGVEVIQIGSTTCGKPYGSFPVDNCGTTYLPIHVQGVNDQGFGDYSQGFSPVGATGVSGVELPGCAVEDDTSRALGDVEEGMLSAALRYRDTGSCPPSVTRVAVATKAMAKARVLTTKPEAQGVTRPLSRNVNYKLIR